MAARRIAPRRESVPHKAFVVLRLAPLRFARHAQSTCVRYGSFGLLCAAIARFVFVFPAVTSKDEHRIHCAPTKRFPSLKFTGRIAMHGDSFLRFHFSSFDGNFLPPNANSGADILCLSCLTADGVMKLKSRCLADRLTMRIKRFPLRGLFALDSVRTESGRENAIYGREKPLSYHLFALCFRFRGGKEKMRRKLRTASLFERLSFQNFYLFASFYFN